MKTLLPLLVLFAACTEPKYPPFQMPKHMDDVRGTMLPYVEGHTAEEARKFMAGNGFVCDAPIASPKADHAHQCHATVKDAGWSGWTVTLLEKKGRVADVEVR